MRQLSIGPPSSSDKPPITALKGKALTVTPHAATRPGADMPEAMLVLDAIDPTSGLAVRVPLTLMEAHDVAAVLAMALHDAREQQEALNAAGSDDDNTPPDATA